MTGFGGRRARRPLPRRASRLLSERSAQKRGHQSRTHTGSHDPQTPKVEPKSLFFPRAEACFCARERARIGRHDMRHAQVRTQKRSKRELFSTFGFCEMRRLAGDCSAAMSSLYSVRSKRDPSTNQIAPFSKRVAENRSQIWCLNISICTESEALITRHTFACKPRSP